MSIHIRHIVDGVDFHGDQWTFGSTNGRADARFGGAHADGSVGLHYWADGALVTYRRKCSTYRKAQRLLLQYLKGYHV